MIFGLFVTALLALPGKGDGYCSPGFTVVSFNTFKATASSPAACASTDNQLATSVNGQTVDRCANTCAFNQSCVGFNQKYTDPTVCDLFTTLPTLFTVNPICTYYEVLLQLQCLIFTARCYAERGIALRQPQVVRPSVCLWRWGIVVA